MHSPHWYHVFSRSASKGVNGIGSTRRLSQWGQSAVSAMGIAELSTRYFITPLNPTRLFSDRRPAAEQRSASDRYFQVTRQSHQAPARSTVLVRENADGAIELRYRGRLVRWSEIPAPSPKSPCPPTPARPRAGIVAPARRGPSGDHPWRRGYDERQERAIAQGRGQ
jgi:hypothetical protein